MQFVAPGFQFIRLIISLNFFIIILFYGLVLTLNEKTDAYLDFTSFNF